MLLNFIAMNIVSVSGCNIDEELFSEDYPSVVARASEIDGAGCGLFACRVISKGEWIGFYGGKRHQSMRTLKSLDYAFNVAKDLIVDPSETPRMMTRYINDHFDPTKRNTIFKRNSRFQYISVYATKNIKNGSELYVSYGRLYWEMKGIYEYITDEDHAQSKIV